MADTILIQGAREHNLKNVNLELPRDRLIVFTGISGSGKSSLAFDTIYAEGQRRYVESPLVLRPPVPRADGQARRRLHRGPVAGHLDRPEDGVPQPPVDGRDRSPRSTTTSGCSTPGSACRTARSAARWSPARRRSRSSTGCSSCPRAPASRCWPRWCGGARASTRTSSPDLAGEGFARARVDGEMRRAVRARSRSTATTSTPSRWSSTDWCGARASSAASPTRWRRRCGWPRGWPRWSRAPRRGRRGREPRRSPSASTSPAPTTARRSRSCAPQLLLQQPIRRLPECDGLGTSFQVDPELVMPDPDLSLADGCYRSVGRRARSLLPAAARGGRASLVRHRPCDAVVEKLSAKQRKVISTGSATRRSRSVHQPVRAEARVPTSYEGVIPYLGVATRDAESDCSREQYEAYMRRGAVPRVRGRPAQARVARR